MLRHLRVPLLFQLSQHLYEPSVGVRLLLYLPLRHLSPVFKLAPSNSKPFHPDILPLKAIVQAPRRNIQGQQLLAATSPQLWGQEEVEGAVLAPEAERILHLLLDLL